MNDETRVLAERAAQGDESALHQLIQRYFPAVRTFIRLRAGPALLGRESTSDLAQSVCRDVLENAGRFRYAGEESFKRWLYTSALRKIADRYEYWRAAKRDLAREQRAGGDAPDLDELGDAELRACYGAAFTPSREAMGREDMQRFETAFEQLSDEHQQVILLSRVLGLPGDEVARQMDRKPGAVRSLLYRAMAALAEQLDDES